MTWDREAGCLCSSNSVAQQSLTCLAPSRNVPKRTVSISRHFSPTFSQGLHGSVLGQCHAWHDHNGKQPHPDIGESVAQLDFPFLLGISATAVAMHLFRARGSLQLQMLLSLSWAGVQVRNTPAHPHVAAPESETFSECVCVSAPASADGSRQRGCEAASEPPE